ncbi:uncharacterized protein [Solanum tuberosum]|uniref:uncharacterized protein n=1 Tax=Solanum tuberosum TaxID=4113 RepID=UPI00073A052B|nr:PREDICTED: uncharacterized protein LOC102580848 [Solanum tuberosum]
MDVKLGFCVLVSLILLVTYGTEARDMAEDNRQQAPEQNSDFVFNYKDGVEDFHPQILFKYKQNKHMHSSSHHSPCLAFTTDITQLAKARYSLRNDANGSNCCLSFGYL